MNKQELIEAYERISSFCGEISVNKAIENLKQLDEPTIYVKNILARLRELPLHDREVWLKAIMGEFEQDFSHAKWREGYEQGKFEGAWVGEQLKDADKIRRELNKPVVPQYIADFITEQKKHGLTLSYSIDASMSDGVAEWYWDNPELFARAWLDGYKVEKEKRYLVKMKNVLAGSSCLIHGHNNEWYYGHYYDSRCDVHHTRKELEEAGFGEVFNSPLFEVEEVE